jgi:hypothetical protein
MPGRWQTLTCTRTMCSRLDAVPRLAEPPASPPLLLVACGLASVQPRAWAPRLQLVPVLIICLFAGDSEGAGRALHRLLLRRLMAGGPRRAAGPAPVLLPTGVELPATRDSIDTGPGQGGRGAAWQGTGGVRRRLQVHLRGHKRMCKTQTSSIRLLKHGQIQKVHNNRKDRRIGGVGWSGEVDANAPL